MKQQSMDVLKLDSAPDRLFQGTKYPKPFEFNQEVADVFDDMVERSVPLYAKVAHLSGQWALRFYQEGSTLYDIGCSTGTVLSYIGSNLHSKGQFVGIDLSAPMIERAQQKLKDFPERHSLKLLQKDVMEVDFKPASVFIMNYTLQFLPVRSRRILIKKIYDALLPGGILFLSEKVQSANQEFQEMVTSTYEEFKLRQGYTRSEIARKKEALENVLIPFSDEEYAQSMEAVGFLPPETLVKWNNFTSFVAQKPRTSAHD